MKISESSNYRSPITADGTDTGTQVGMMNATVDSSNQSLNISAVLNQGTTVTAATVQAQLTAFISAIRANANAMGLTAFGEGN